MNLEHLLQSETPNQESVLARLGKGSRAKLMAFFMTFAPMAGCATANTNYPVQKKTALRDNAVEEACSKLGRIQISGAKLPPELNELNRMCMAKDALEGQMAQLKGRQPAKAQE